MMTPPEFDTVVLDIVDYMWEGADVAAAAV
jgi:hypothetical protein